MSAGSPDKRILMRNFNRAAAGYDQYAALQMLVLERLLEQLPVFRVQPGIILDAGSGTGRAARPLGRLYPRATQVQLDIAEAMLKISKKTRPRWFSRTRRVCADAEAMPMADAAVDLVFSSLMLQWCPRAGVALAECARVLRPEGLFLFATMGPLTLFELRESWQQADEQAHVHSFADIHWLGDELVRRGFTQPVLESECVMLTYPDVRAVMLDLRRIGAVNSGSDRRRGLTGKNRYRRCLENYEQFRSDGRMPATFEIIYGHAWRSQQSPANKSQVMRFVSPEHLKGAPE